LKTSPTQRTSPAADLPPGVSPVATPLDALASRLTLRLDEVAAALGVSRRAIERERSSGRFPKPDLVMGRMPLWRPDTIRDWLERGGRP
jgi:predicted DNA-binding transcriptional regulator AlpA